MRLFSTAFLCVLLSAFPFITKGQMNTASMDLETCVRYALENNIQVRLQKLNVEQNDVQLTQSKHERYPNLNGNVGHNYTWGRSFDVFTNAPVTQRVQSNSFSINSNLILFNGLRVSNTIRQAGLRKEASLEDLKKQENDLALGVITAYINILFNKENLENARRQLQNSSEQLQRTELLVRQGALPEANLLDLQSQNANDRLLVVQSENNLSLSFLQLRQLLQIQDDGSPFDVVTPALDLPTNATLETIAQIYREAEGSLPEIKSADINVRSAELGIRIAQANYYPTLSVGGNLSTFYSSAQLRQVVGQRPTGEINTVPIGYFETPLIGTRVPVFTDIPVTERITQDFPFWQQLEESSRKGFGFNLSIPIYNRNQAKAGVQTAQIQREQARLNAMLVRNQVRQDVENAYYNVAAAVNTYNANKARSGALQETFRAVEQRYTAGTLNITDFQVARNNLANAQSDLIRAKYDLIFRRKILDFYMGRELKL